MFLECKDLYCGSYISIYLSTRRHIQKTVFLAFVTTVDTVNMLQCKCKKQSPKTMQKLKLLCLFDDQSNYGLKMWKSETQTWTSYLPFSKHKWQKIRLTLINRGRVIRFWIMILRLSTRHFQQKNKTIIPCRDIRCARLIWSLMAFWFSQK